MGPPLEHGGMTCVCGGCGTGAAPLQWGRRLNTAECWGVKEGVVKAMLASMGPPLEHGGMNLARNKGNGVSKSFNGAAA